MPGVFALLVAVLSTGAPAGAQGAPEGRTAAAAAPASPVSSAAAVAPGDGRWQVLAEDLTLRRTLERWAARAGYRLRWDAARNFLVGAPDVFDGSFEDAVRAVLGSAGIRGSDYPLEACVYANTPPLLRVTRLGEQSRECGGAS